VSLTEGIAYRLQLFEEFVQGESNPLLIVNAAPNLANHGAGDFLPLLSRNMPRTMRRNAIRYPSPSDTAAFLRRWPGPCLPCSG